MTMTLAHPEAEDLGRFAEGTLDDTGRAAIVAHVADCDECRIVVVDATEFVEPEVVHSDWRRWVGVAAAVVLVVAGSTFIYRETRDPLAKTREAYSRLQNRPMDVRFGDFPYVPWRWASRGSNDEVDLSLEIMRGEAVEAAELRGQSAKTLDRRGIGLLLDEHLDEAVDSFEKATAGDPNNARYQSDLSAALILSAGKAKSEADRRRQLEQAVQACKRAQQIDPHATAALFNQAIALQALDRPDDAITMYKRYLDVDPASQWASEVKDRIERLRPPH
jgi:tetratricopeptide (TPR) repeat protein